jgi:alpha-galactosidase
VRPEGTPASAAHPAIPFMNPDKTPCTASHGPAILPRPVRILLLAASACLAVPGAALASGLNGTWRMDQPKDSGVVLHSIIILHQDGARIEGSVWPNYAVRMPILDARMEGEDLSFRIADWGWSFRVRPDGEALHVAISYDSWKTSETVTARPASPSDTQLPPIVPPPALRELPANGLSKAPPMGWNSWNHFSEGVDDRVVRETADAMVSSGMAAAGYTYVNIDDTWELGRDAQGNILPNRKFPDMKALADYVHARGLKIGIYSSPGPTTCGGYEGSYGHEEQDARAYAAWGIDYLKYDWCSASRLYAEKDLRAVYQRMGEALQKCGRPIVYSLCEYGVADVWKWGPAVGGNLWRTTGDIQDHWRSMCANGLDQGRLAPYAAPGHWNDPDMLEVGNGGMSPVEYRTHFSLWCMLAAPLIAGNDLRSMSADTVEILTNREVIAVDQDPLGAQGARVLARDGVETWVKPLSGGAQAVCLFNLNAEPRDVSLAWGDIGRASTPAVVRDLWRHADIAPAGAGFTGRVQAHGAVMLLVR